MHTDTDFYWWVPLAIVNAGLAETKGRSRWYWFLISLLIGPVATFLIVVWKPRTETGKPAAVPTRD